MRRAITDGAFAFVACFSSRSLARTQGRQYEELILAVEQMQARLPGEPWLIPVRLDDCLIPDLDIGAGRTLRSLRPADLFGDRAGTETERLITSILRILGRPARQAGPPGTPDSEPGAGPGPAGPAGTTPPARRQSMWQRFMAWDVAIRAALIGGACVLIAGLVPYLLGAYTAAPRSGGSPSAGSSQRTSPASPLASLGTRPPATLARQPVLTFKQAQASLLTTGQIKAIAGTNVLTPLSSGNGLLLDLSVTQGQVPDPCRLSAVALPAPGAYSDVESGYFNGGSIGGGATIAEQVAAYGPGGGTAALDAAKAAFTGCGFTMAPGFAPQVIDFRGTAPNLNPGLNG